MTRNANDCPATPRHALELFIIASACLRQGLAPLACHQRAEVWRGLTGPEGLEGWEGVGVVREGRVGEKALQTVIGAVVPVGPRTPPARLDRSPAAARQRFRWQSTLLCSPCRSALLRPYWKAAAT